MKSKLLLALSVSALMSGCAAFEPHSYWHEAANSAATTQQSGSWQGLVRDQALFSVQHTRLGMPASVRCDRYTDLITLTPDQQGNLQIHLGSEPVFTLQAQLESDGHFKSAIPVTGHTEMYGGLNVFQTQPTLTVEGTLDQSTGLGKGEVRMGPAEGSLACKGSFHVSYNSVTPNPAQEDEEPQPFKIYYEMNELQQNNDWLVH